MSRQLLMSENVTIVDIERRQWLHFVEPCLTLCTSRLEEIRPALQRIAELVESDRLAAAGFIGYEAAAAFDSALQTFPSSDLPVLWFGLFRKVETHREFPFRRGGRFAIYTPWQPTVTRAAYDQSFAKIKGAIARGDTYQVNHTMRLRAACSGDPATLMFDLSRSQRTGHLAYIELEDWAICSVSPELFFRLDGNQITCRPMKGTRPRGCTTAEDRQIVTELQQSEKDRAENVMVVDMIRNDLGRIAEFGSVRVPELLTVEKYPTVWQMTSTVTAQTSATLAEIMTALFPCASVTGPPKPRTMRIISELESTPRQIYTGAIGYYLPGRRAQFSVAIRTALIDKRSGRIEYGVGSGVVWDSICADEYDECLVKAAVLMRERTEFDLFETILWTPENGYLLLERHLCRLRDSAEYFGWKIEIENVRAELEIAAREFDAAPLRVRLTLKESSEIVITSRLISAAMTSLAEANTAAVWQVKVAETPVDAADRFLYHKTTNRRVYEDAIRTAGGCDDVVLFNERGEVTESTIANVVACIGGRLLTPPIVSGLLAGTFRAELLAQGIISERVITVEELRKAEQVYLINSVRGWVLTEWADSAGSRATPAAEARIDSESR